MNTTLPYSATQNVENAILLTRLELCHAGATLVLVQVQVQVLKLHGVLTVSLAFSAEASSPPLSHRLLLFLLPFLPLCFFCLLLLLFLPSSQQDNKSSPLLPPDLLKSLADLEEEEELVFAKPPDFFQALAGPLSSAAGPNIFVCSATFC